MKRSVLLVVFFYLISFHNASARNLGTTKDDPSVKPSVTKPAVKPRGKPSAVRNSSTAEDKLSPKVNRILKRIKQARKLGDLKINDKNLSKKEKEQLKAELKKSEYVGKLKSLVKKAKSARKRALKQKVGRIKSEYKNRQKQKLQRFNAQAMAKIQQLRSKHRRGGVSKTNSGSFRSVSPETRRQLAVPPAVSQGTISAVTPQPVEVGGELDISGSNFGNETGVVSIAFDRTMIECTVTSWHHNRIVATIPDIVESIVGATTRSARLWVRAAGQTIGPSRLIDIGPTERRLTPLITSVSPREIWPGQMVFITGENFLERGSSSRVDFRLSRPPGGVSLGTHTAIIEYWDNSTIAVHIPENTGGLLRQSRLDIEVRNSAGNMGYSPMCALYAYLAVEVLSEEFEYSEGGWHGLFFSWCWAKDYRTRNFTSFQGKVLQNDWKIVDVELVKDDDSCNGECSVRYTTSPRVGSTNMESQIRMRSKPGVCTATNTITIEGPATSPFE